MGSDHKSVIMRARISDLRKRHKFDKHAKGVSKGWKPKDVLAYDEEVARMLEVKGDGHTGTLLERIEETGQRIE